MNGSWCPWSILLVFPQCLPMLFPIIEVPFLGHASNCFRPNLLPFYIPYPWFPDTIFSPISYTLTVNKDQADRWLILIK
jgi:hypothetical protein